MQIPAVATATLPAPRKDLALMLISYGNVYVAQVGIGANSEQTLIAMRETEAYSGPSLILAYGQCIAHGIHMRFGMNRPRGSTVAMSGSVHRRDVRPLRCRGNAPQL